MWGSAIVLNIFFIVHTATAQSTATYWSNYPYCSELCHQENFAASGCSLTNACLCRNTNWLDAVAACVALNCPVDQLTQTAEIKNNACEGSNTPMALTEQEFIDAGDAALASSTVASSAAPTPSITTVTANPSLGSTLTGVVPTSSSSSSSSSSSPTVSTVVTLPSTSTSTSTSTSNPSTTTSSSSPLPSCGDDSWDASPLNWVNVGVDQSLVGWWAYNVTSAQKNSNSFVELLANITDDENEQCGIGPNSFCTPPKCTDFQPNNFPKWVYFARVALVQMGLYLNTIDEGMTKSQESLNSLTPDIASLFPWKDPKANLHKALPWVEAGVSSALSFIPILGSFIKVGGDLGTSLLDGLSETAGQFADAGLKTLEEKETTAINQDLGTIKDLGVEIYTSFKGAHDSLDSWSQALFNGSEDDSGNNIIDYMANGRWMFDYSTTSDQMAQFFVSMLVSQFVNAQWKNNSKTFVMCADSTNTPCGEASRFQESQRSCCLYSLDGKANYIAPPSLDQLSNSTFNILPSSITASSLRSYLVGKFDYDESHFNQRLEDSFLGDPSQQAFLQGVGFEGIWTLPVCDVGSQTSWVDDYSARKLPCCCGLDCNETQTFLDSARIAGNKNFNNACKKQYPEYISMSVILHPCMLLVALGIVIGII